MFPFRLGVYVDTPDLLYQSYECAAEALKYRYSRGMGAILTVRRRYSARRILKIFPRIEKISLAIRSGDKAKMEEHLDHIETWIRERMVGRTGHGDI